MLPTKEVPSLKWICQSCEGECIPIRSESRCLCGHRLKEHTEDNYGCKNKTCACKSFFFIVAEGAWVLRCRCKHKHIEHDPVGHGCRKAKCDCTQFDSPWVCNCDHPWKEHKQVLSTKEVVDVAKIVGGNEDGLELGEGMAREINRWDLIRRGDT